MEDDVRQVEDLAETLAAAQSTRRGRGTYAFGGEQPSEAGFDASLAELVDARKRQEQCYCGLSMMHKSK